MDLKKLFSVLVVGGIALGAAACSGGTDQNPQKPSAASDGGTNPDGGTPGGG